jgi:hypothetical protein
MITPQGTDYFFQMFEFCEKEYKRFYDCTLSDTSLIKKNLKSILDRKMEEFNRLYLTLRCERF